MSYPPHLLDELARVFARVALHRLLKESAAREPRPESTGDSEHALPLPNEPDVVDGDDSG